jgi:hypothetical protein
VSPTLILAAAGAYDIDPFGPTSTLTVTAFPVAARKVKEIATMASERAVLRILRFIGLPPGRGDVKDRSKG